MLLLDCVRLNNNKSIIICNKKFDCGSKIIVIVTSVTVIHFYRKNEKSKLK